ncbi:serine/threonine kinase 16 [Exophiala viscosa]|uniref:Serine/threonine kinase 16 n=1 Tax=Exophiala viscosa TaxID=2486360 RepID=A0AAN6DRE9_9EURO|nr:serine/threonine kinase 16 [Exophiala viscosa]
MSPFFGHEDVHSTAMWPPGTVRLEDMAAAAKKDIILQPRPSSDPNDPLNWSLQRKYWNFVLVCLYVAMVAEFINASTPTWGPMNEELGYSYEILNDSYAAGCAALALGSLILIPFALKFGRRPLYLFSTVLQFALSIWSAKMQTVADLMLINILQCLFGSLAEAIVQMTVADVFFVHQRGRMNAIYVWVWLACSYLGSFIAGYVAQGEGWRAIWWWNTGFFGIIVFIVAFGYEETKYRPSAPSSLALDASPPSTHVHSSDLAQAVNSYDKMDVADTKPPVDTQTKTDSSHDPAQAVEEGSLQNVHSVMIDPNIPRKTYWQRLAITTSTSSSGESNQAFLRHMYQPLILLFTIPAITYAALVYGILVGLGDVMSTTMSTFLTEPPYNFSSGHVGLMHLPRVIGVTIGAAIGGPLSDWTILYLSRRRNGIYDPELRLWAIIPFLPFVPAGALMFGIGLNNGVSWPIIAVGLVLYNIGVTPINSIIVTYLTDSYREVIGDAMVAVTVVRNSFSTAFIFALTPWIAVVGVKWVFVTILLIACAILMASGVFIRWGKTFRHMFAPRYEYYALRQYKER